MTESLSTSIDRLNEPKPKQFQKKRFMNYNFESRVRPRQVIFKQIVASIYFFSFSLNDPSVKEISFMSHLFAIEVNLKPFEKSSVSLILISYQHSTTLFQSLELKKVVQVERIERTREIESVRESMRELAMQKKIESVSQHERV